MAYSANGNEFNTKFISRVKYNLIVDGNNITLPKAPELIKIANAVALDIFFDSGNDYEPITVDYTTLNGEYGGQIFIDVTEGKNLVFLSQAVEGDCLDKMNIFVNNIF